MKQSIENLKAKMRGVQLNSYQNGLALDEFYKLLDYIEKLEKALGITNIEKGVWDGMVDEI